jgi:hypothetical protein
MSKKDMSKVKGAQRYKKVRELAKAGLTVPQIRRAGLVNLSDSTMYLYVKSKHEEYADYCKEITEKIKANRQEKEDQVCQPEEPVKEDTADIEGSELDNDEYAQVVLDQLQAQTELLYEIKEILSNLKVKLF